MMRTNLKMILAATAIAAVASPVMAAQSESQTHAAPLPASIANAHGHVVRGRTAADADKASQIRPNDCAHATFPQCSDDATLPQTDRP
jgi:hypothetical protein